MSLTAYSLAEFLELPPPEWLIEGILPLQGLSALYGQPGDGKTFIALDMALSIASGLDWQGHPVRKGCVVYISAEGGGGLSKRVGAWLDQHHMHPEAYKSVFAHFIVSAIKVHPESTDLSELIEQSIESVEYRRNLIAECMDGELPVNPNENQPPLVVIVDTLSRCFEGDENQQEDMGYFIKGLDWLRQEQGATVEVVHHTNKSSLNERGSSVFRGACDTMMLVEKKEKAITLSCTKQKDYDQFEDIGLELHVVPDWNSCVVQTPMDIRNPEQKDQWILDILQQKQRLSWNELVEAIGSQKMSLATLKRRVVSLSKTKQIIKKNGYWRILEAY